VFPRRGLVRRISRAHADEVNTDVLLGERALSFHVRLVESLNHIVPPIACSRIALDRREMVDAREAGAENDVLQIVMVADHVQVGRHQPSWS